MGLDFGLTMIGKTIRGKKFLDEHFKHDESDYSPGEFEFFYFRKCWNVRGRVLQIFSDKYNAETQQIELTIPDLYTIVEKVLKYFLIEENWSIDGESIWEWHTELRTFAYAILDLREFMELADDMLITDDDIEIYIYDSY